MRLALAALFVVCCLLIGSRSLNIREIFWPSLGMPLITIIDVGDPASTLGAWDADGGPWGTDSYVAPGVTLTDNGETVTAISDGNRNATRLIVLCRRFALVCGTPPAN